MLTRSDFEHAERGDRNAKAAIDRHISALRSADPSRTYQAHYLAARCRVFADHPAAVAPVDTRKGTRTAATVAPTRAASRSRVTEAAALMRAMIDGTEPARSGSVTLQGMVSVATMNEGREARGAIFDDVSDFVSFCSDLHGGHAAAHAKLNATTYAERILRAIGGNPSDLSPDSAQRPTGPPEAA